MFEVTLDNAKTIPEVYDELLAACSMAMTIEQMKDLYTIIDIRDDSDEEINDIVFTVFLTEREDLEEDDLAEGTGWDILEERMSYLKSA